MFAVALMAPCGVPAAVVALVVVAAAVSGACLIVHRGVPKRAVKVSTLAILACLVAGSVYASQGPIVLGPCQIPCGMVATGQISWWTALLLYACWC